ncbi:hypothetical protein DL93DRAFT_1672451 [Clavulina sp. PMI_390]|nr:hypothetical protein DL93DRAFT_1672451 [Clavulina sp. PMI_390]
MESAASLVPKLYRNASSGLQNAGICEVSIGEDPLAWSSIVPYAFRCAAAADDWHEAHPRPSHHDVGPNRFSFIDSRTGQQTTLYATTHQRVMSRTLFKQSRNASRISFPVLGDVIEYAWRCSMLDSGLERGLKKCCPPELCDDRTMDHHENSHAAVSYSPTGYFTYPRIEPTFAHTFVFSTAGITLWFLCPPTAKNLLALRNFTRTVFTTLSDFFSLLEKIEITVTRRGDLLIIPGCYAHWSFTLQASVHVTWEVLMWRLLDSAVTSLLEQADSPNSQSAMLTAEFGMDLSQFINEALVRQKIGVEKMQEWTNTLRSMYS